MRRIPDSQDSDFDLLQNLGNLRQRLTAVPLPLECSRELPRLTEFFLGAKLEKKTVPLNKMTKKSAPYLVFFLPVYGTKNSNFRPFAQTRYLVARTGIRRRDI